MSKLFNKTKRLEEALSVIHGISDDRYELVLDHLASHLADTDVPFNTEEEKKLESILELETAQVRLVVDVSLFFFEQAAFHTASPDTLKKALLDAEVSEEKTTLISQAWKRHGKAAMAALRARTLGGPSVLRHTTWHLDAELASNSMAKTTNLRAIFNFQCGCDVSDSKSSFAVEFGKEELSQLHTDLELIQSQLDALVTGGRS